MYMVVSNKNTEQESWGRIPQRTIYRRLKRQRINSYMFEKKHTIYMIIKLRAIFVTNLSSKRYMEIGKFGIQSTLRRSIAI